MRFVTATIAEIVGLFVGDWFQAIGILVVVALAYAASRFAEVPLLGFVLAIVLAAHLVWTSTRESRNASVS